MLALVASGLREGEGEHIGCIIDSSIVSVKVLYSVIASDDQADVHRLAYTSGNERSFYHSPYPILSNKADERLFDLDAQPAA